MSTHSWTAFVDSFNPEVTDSAYAADLAVRDVDLPGVPARASRLRVVLTGGAAQLAGPVAYCDGRDHLVLDALDTSLRDVDDPAGNARRVVSAAADLPQEIRLHVRVDGEATPRWLEALDVLAEATGATSVVALSLERLDPEPWIDAALDRELPVSLTEGSLDQAIAALRTTARLWGDADDLGAARRWCQCWLPADAATAADAVATLEQRHDAR